MVSADLQKPNIEMKPATLIKRIASPAHRALGRAKGNRWYQKDFLFIHINKTAGKSIQSALGIDHRHNTAIEYRALLAEKGKKIESKFSFAFVRNPWDRIVSLYSHRLSIPKMRLQRDNISFDQFIDLAIVKKTKPYYDSARMHMPQTQWICDYDGSVMVDFVGRYESLRHDFSRITQRLGIRAELPWKNSSSRTHYTHYYTPRLRDLVGRIYQADVDAFGYSFE